MKTYNVEIPLVSDDASQLNPVLSTYLLRTPVLVVDDMFAHDVPGSSSSHPRRRPAEFTPQNFNCRDADDIPFLLSSE